MARARPIANLGAANFGAANFGAANFGAANFGAANFGAANFGAANFGALIGLVEELAGSSDRGCWPDGADRANQRPGGDKLSRACWPGPDALRRGEPTPADRVRKAARGRLF